MKHYADMEDAERWQMHEHLLKFSAPPPYYAVQRVRGFDNFALRTNQTIKSIVSSDNEALLIETETILTEVDHVIFATGFDVDLSKVPELSPLYPSIALWRDRYESAAGAPSVPQGKYPYLGSHFEYQEKLGGAMPCLRNLYEFGPAGTLSLGMTCVGLNSLNFGVRRLVDGVTRSLFLDDLPRRMEKLLDIDPMDHSGNDGFSGLAKL
jgi:hypothetical protein